MNSYPSWIQRIPEMIETLARLDREWIDRELAERIFDLGQAAAFQLLRRLGAQRCSNSLVIARGLLIARLREAHENHDLRWEGERRQSVQWRIESLETQRRRKSLVPVDAALQEQMEELRTVGLPGTIQLTEDCSSSAATTWKISWANSSCSPKHGYRLRKSSGADRSAGSSPFTGLGS